MKTKLKKQLLLIPLALILLSFSYSNSVQSDLSGNLIRLHIIANSDSQADQQIKLHVRNKIIEAVGQDFSHIRDKKAYRAELTKRTAEIKQIADLILAENGVPYKSEVSFEKQYIPRKSYDGLILPEGSYEGLMVRLGDAQGQNWWCVVYPPLCFTESTCGELSDEAKDYLKETLSPESYSLITKEGIRIEYKFKLLEYMEKAKKFSSETFEKYLK